MYTACGSPCEQTCANIGDEKEAYCEDAQCVEGCFCADGFVRHGRLTCGTLNKLGLYITFLDIYNIVNVVKILCVAVKECGSGFKCFWMFLDVYSLDLLISNDIEHYFGLFQVMSAWRP